jgi:hypothetical protein
MYINDWTAIFAITIPFGIAMLLAGCIVAHVIDHCARLMRNLAREPHIQAVGTAPENETVAVTAEIDAIMHRDIASICVEFWSHVLR